MKIDMLLTNIRNKNFDLAREIQVKTYLPMDAKKAIAQGIIYDCTDNSEGVIKVDSVERYLSYVKYMITMHTNLEYTNDDYDKLCATEYQDMNLLNAILSCFGEDAQECSRILDSMMDDLLMENSLEYSVARFVNSLNNQIGNLADKLNSKLDNVDIQSVLSGVDMNKLSVFLDKYIK